MSGDDTTKMPTPGYYIDTRAVERRLLFALFFAYLVAGGVLAFALLELEAVAEQLNTSPICRRL